MHMPQMAEVRMLHRCMQDGLMNAMEATEL